MDNAQNNKRKGIEGGSEFQPAKKFKGDLLSIVATIQVTAGTRFTDGLNQELVRPISYPVQIFDKSVRTEILEKPMEEQASDPLPSKPLQSLHLLDEIAVWERELQAQSKSTVLQDPLANLATIDGIPIAALKEYFKIINELCCHPQDYPQELITACNVPEDSSRLRKVLKQLNIILFSSLNYYLQNNKTDTSGISSGLLFCTTILYYKKLEHNGRLNNGELGILLKYKDNKDSGKAASKIFSLFVNATKAIAEMKIKDAPQEVKEFYATYNIRVASLLMSCYFQNNPITLVFYDDTRESSLAILLLASATDWNLLISLYKQLGLYNIRVLIKSGQLGGNFALNCFSKLSRINMYCHGLTIDQVREIYGPELMQKPNLFLNSSNFYSCMKQLTLLHPFPSTQEVARLQEIITFYRSFGQISLKFALTHLMPFEVSIFIHADKTISLTELNEKTKLSKGTAFICQSNKSLSITAKLLTDTLAEVKTSEELLCLSSNFVALFFNQELEASKGISNDLDKLIDMMTIPSYGNLPLFLKSDKINNYYKNTMIHTIERTLLDYLKEKNDGKIGTMGISSLSVESTVRNTFNTCRNTL